MVGYVGETVSAVQGKGWLCWRNREKCGLSQGLIILMMGAECYYIFIKRYTNVL